MHEVVKTNSNLLPPHDDPSHYSQAEVQSRVFGSKLVLLVEQMQILTIWLLKACLLIMYNRMTHLLPQHKTVIGTAVYVATTFVRTTFALIVYCLTECTGCYGDTLLRCLVPSFRSILGCSYQFK
jgi:hypothetical protein